MYTEFSWLIDLLRVTAVYLVSIIACVLTVTIKRSRSRLSRGTATLVTWQHSCQSNASVYWTHAHTHTWLFSPCRSLHRQLSSLSYAALLLGNADVSPSNAVAMTTRHDAYPSWRKVSGSALQISDISNSRHVETNRQDDWKDHRLHETHSQHDYCNAVQSYMSSVSTHEPSPVRTLPCLSSCTAFLTIRPN